MSDIDFGLTSFAEMNSGQHSGNGVRPGKQRSEPADRTAFSRPQESIPLVFNRHEGVVPARIRTDSSGDGGPMVRESVPNADDDDDAKFNNEDGSEGGTSPVRRKRVRAAVLIHCDCVPLLGLVNAHIV